jgi:hypothetical protein
MRTYGLTKNICWCIKPICGFGFLIMKPRRLIGCEPFVEIVIGCFCLYIAPKSSWTGWKWNPETGHSEKFENE